MWAKWMRGWRGCVGTWACKWRESNFGMSGAGAWGVLVCKILAWIKKKNGAGGEGQNFGVGAVGP